MICILLYLFAVVWTLNNGIVSILRNVEERPPQACVQKLVKGYSPHLTQAPPNGRKLGAR